MGVLRLIIDFKFALLRMATGSKRKIRKNFNPSKSITYMVHIGTWHIKIIFVPNYTQKLDISGDPRVTFV